MAGQRGEFLSVFQVPQLDRVVPRRGCQKSTIAGERDRRDLPAVPGQQVAWSGFQAIPQLHLVIPRSGHNSFSVVADANRGHGPAVPGQHPLLFAARSRFQMRAVLSREPEMTWSSRGPKHTDVMAPVCPRSSRTGCPQCDVPQMNGIVTSGSSDQRSVVAERDAAFVARLIGQLQFQLARGRVPQGDTVESG